MFSGPATQVQDDWTSAVGLGNHDKATKHALHEIWITESVQRSLQGTRNVSKTDCGIRDSQAAYHMVESGPSASLRQPGCYGIVLEPFGARRMRSDLAAPLAVSRASMASAFKSHLRGRWVAFPRVEHGV
jgi:hypothetical protein